MSHYPPSVLRLIREFTRLPGVGGKTAERLALHVLRAPKKEAQALADALIAVKETVRFCTSCFGLSDAEVCRICADPGRNRQVVCVVEQPAELVAIEKAGAFTGIYHVLQGVLSPMDGIGPDQLRINELLDRVRGGEIEEVVIATGTNVEGDATAAYLAEQLAPLSVRVTRIASGVPLGGDLRYVDGMTLKRAMDTRHAL
jgi:recombination protein RecR